MNPDGGSASGGVDASLRGGPSVSVTTWVIVIRNAFCKSNSRYYQLISIFYFLNIFTILIINFIKNGSGHHSFIIFGQNRDIALIC